jgi:segregation and condensation protein A
VSETDEIEGFDDLGGPETDHSGALVLDLEGYEGPIDMLLQLARDQKVDLTRISILALANQYLDFIGRARKLRLELAADYLVMAAWLAYLKSRLLLPEPEEGEEPSGAEMAAALKYQLQRLQAMQDVGERLMALPRLGRDVFARGEPVPLRIVADCTYDISLYELLSAYGRSRSRGQVTALRIDPADLYSVDEALSRLVGLLGKMPGWQTLSKYLPAELKSGPQGGAKGEVQDRLLWRSAIASTLAASLELSKQGRLRLRQDGAFAPIYLLPSSSSSSSPGPGPGPDRETEPT